MKLSWMDEEMQALIPLLSVPQVVAVCLYGEARSEPIEGIVAVANVIRNRVKADIHGDNKPDWWGEGYSDVVTRPWQFSMWHVNGGATNYKRVKAFAQHLAERKEAVGIKARQCIGVAHCIVGDYFADNVNGADHYHAVKVPEVNGKPLSRPFWALKRVPVKQVGGHVFYKLHA